MKTKKINGQEKRMSLTEALVNLVSLLESWQISNKEYVLVDEFSYLLQGYDVSGREIQSGHLDMYVDPKKLPWTDKKERSIIPPKEGGFMDQWTDFMQKTGYSLDLLRADEDVFKVPMIKYELPNGKSIQLMRVFEMTQAFIERTLMHYSLKEVDEEKIKEWIQKLELIKNAAERKKDKRLMKLCDEKLKKVKLKWKNILND